MAGAAQQSAGAPRRSAQGVLMSSAQYADVQQLEWALGVRDLVLFGPRSDDVVVTLCGDAGAGKSRALTLLLDALKRVSLDHVVCMTATTNAAVNAAPSVRHTTHSALGINNRVLLEHPFRTPAEKDSFRRHYIEYNSNHLVALQRLRAMSPGILEMIKTKHPEHSCVELTPRCYLCFLAMWGARCDYAPAAWNKPMLVIDEYAMMSAELFEKFMCAHEMLTMKQQGRVVVLVGSVSQLSWPNSTLLTNSERFVNDHVCTTHLWHNFRQSSELADALTCMQFNVVTEACARLLAARVIGEEKACDPKHLPSALRIFNQNARREAFNQACMRGKTLVHLEGLRISGSTQDRKKLLDQLSAQFKLLFAGDARKHVDKPLDVYKGCPVIVTRTAVAQYTRGVFRGTSAMEIGPPAVLVEDRGGNITTVIRAQEIEGGATATFYPIAVSNAINTYTAQGATAEGDVVYVGPARDYFRSQILASAYVACSRVRCASALHLANAAFARQANSNAPFFQEEVLRYKLAKEMGYKLIMRRKRRRKETLRPSGENAAEDIALHCTHSYNDTE
ncbi:ORF93 [Ranid herpesvirus 1]|uniref:ORF93 n=1 Tax=Ranid herpesvirus 1 TaxID=85655 RepID=Q14VN7_9VIRU|nr:ORF93 [Ranid herpesvirus 1]ABG25724.1 ORF93 [Ranid herpesvirus 1]